MLTFTAGKFRIYTW